MKVVITIEGEKQEVEELVEKFLKNKEKIEYVPMHPPGTFPVYPTWDWSKVTCTDTSGK